MKNTELAYKALDHIRENPEEWDQEYFFCGTTACYAGTVILIALGVSGEKDYDRWLENNPLRCETGHFAARLLGWTPAEAEHVFYNYTKDFTVLEKAVKQVLNGEVG
jgi:hypothetical protein